MHSLTIPDFGLSLGSRQSSAKSDSTYHDIFSLTLTDSVIEDMIKCVHNKRPIQLSLGNNPKIIYGSQTQNLESTLDSSPCDYIRTTLLPDSSPSTSTSTSTSTTQSGSSDDMPQTSCLWGGSRRKLVPQNIRTYRNGVLVSQTAPPAAKLPQKDTASQSGSPNLPALTGVDAALAMLKSSMASENAKKKDNTTKHIKDTSGLPPAVQQRGPARPIKEGNKARFLSQSNKANLSSNAARSMPTSPALTGMSSPALGPTSVPASQQQAERAKAIRGPIIHKLALGPAAEHVIFEYKMPNVKDQEFKLALQKVAELEDGKWRLKDRSFKDLDVFAFKKYTAEERQIAIDNAIHVYDKLRLSGREPEWDRLLPMEERGTGKCLSKLQARIAVGAIQPAKAPRTKVQGAEDSGRDTVVEGDEDDLFGEKIPTTKTKSAKMARSHSNPPVTKQKRTSEKELQAKHLLAKGKSTKSTSTKSSNKKPTGKESTKIKSSKFVRESDEDDSYLLPSNTRAPTSSTQSKANGTSAPQVKPATNTARDDSDDMDPKPIINKKPRVNNTSPQKSSPLVSTPLTNASDFEDSSSSSLTNSLKRKVTDSSSDAPISKRHQKSSSHSTNSSVASSINAVNGDRLGEAHWNEVRQDISATRKFNLYYSKYLDLYREISASPGRNVEKMADLNDMRDRLVVMKASIISAYEART